MEDITNQYSSYEEFNRQLREHSQNKLEIKNSAIRFGNSYYPTSNIASISKGSKTFKQSIYDKRKFWKTWGIVLLIGTTVLTLMKMPFIGALILTFIVSMLLLGTMKNNGAFDDIVTHKFYTAQIQTNAGSVDLFMSKDGSFIQKVIGVMVGVLEKPSKSVEYYVNIEKQEINDHSVNHVYNDNRIHLDIQYNEGMTQEDLSFLMGEFTNSLQQINQKLDELDSKEGKENIREIVEELNSSKPESSKIKKSWNALKEASSAYDISEMILELSPLMSRAIGLFA